MSKTFEELVTECFVAYATQPNIDKTPRVIGSTIVPTFQKIAEGLVEANKKRAEFYKVGESA